jgi:MoxR-like ATPase
MVMSQPKYIKHSQRKVRNENACHDCGTSDLYWAHEQIGPVDQTDPSYCEKCQSNGVPVLVDADTLRPHSCTETISGEPAEEQSDGEQQAEGQPEPADEDTAGDVQVQVQSGVLGELEKAAAEAEAASAEADAVAEQLGSADPTFGVGSDAGSDGGEEDEDKHDPPCPDDDEFVTHRELNEIDPLSRSEAKTAFDNVKDGFSQVKEFLTVLGENDQSHVKMITALNDALKELERRTVVTISIHDKEADEIHDIQGLQHRQLADVIRMLSAEHCLMVGGAGAGKGEIAYQAAMALGIPFYTLDQGSLSQQTPVSSIIGYMNSTGNYVGTTFRQAFEHGGLIFLDELDNAAPTCIASINAALAVREGQTIGFPGGQMVPRHKDFRVLAAANTFGRGPDRTYAARSRGDAATWDRFAILKLDYDNALEDVLCRRTGLDEEICLRVVRYVRALRANVEKYQATIPVVIGMRASVGVCKLLKAGIEPDLAVEARCRRGMSDQDWDKISNGVLHFMADGTASWQAASSASAKPASDSTPDILRPDLLPDPWKPGVESVVVTDADGTITARYVRTRSDDGTMVSVNVPQLCIQLVTEGRSIPAVEALRKASGLSLVQAKEIISQLRKDLSNQSAEAMA